MLYSLVVPVFNRPDEVRELLESLIHQTYIYFEVILVEDGSTLPCKEEADAFSEKLNLHYFTKPNSGPGLSRNFGAAHSKGDFILFLDSDCVLPPSYLEEVHAGILQEKWDCFGGPDRAHPSFTSLQRAINYAMTSFFTTGGIRGGKKRMDQFFPRSFNMGFSRAVFDYTGGFSSMRFGEDIDMSLRIQAGGFRMGLIPEAYVYHKRRTRFWTFYKQVFNSGIARINLFKIHPQALKLVHFLPSVFVLGHLVCMVLAVWCFWFLAGPIFFMLLVCFDAWRSDGHAKVGFLAVPAAYIQLFGYGLGFLLAVWKRLILRQGPFAAFTKKFYA